MGSSLKHLLCHGSPFASLPNNMKPMKAVTSMTKGQIAEALATESGLKKSECAKLMGVLAGVATKQVKKAGKFVLPGVCMIKTRVKPATKSTHSGRGSLRHDAEWRRH